MKAKKIEKEFLLTDDSVNVYGFRLLTSGYLVDRYKANPIGFRQHKRADGIVVRWDGFRVDADKVYAKPTVNLANPLGQQTADEVENGFLNAASVGGIVVLEFSDAEDLMLPGQTGPTITKWYNKEISLVDVPGNPSATVQLYDAEDNEINLADFVQQTIKKRPLNLMAGFNTNQNNNQTDMSNLKVLLISALALADTVTDNDLEKAVQDLVDNAAKVPGLEKDLADAEKREAAAKQELKDHKAAATAAQVKDLVDAAVATGKITAKLGTDLSAKYADDVEGLKALVEGLPSYKPVTEKIAEAGAGVSKTLADKSWDELDKAGKLQDLKAADFDAFKEKYFEKFNKQYNA